MSDIRFISTISLLILFIVGTLFASEETDVFVLKNQRRLEGKVQEEAANGFMVETLDGQRVFIDKKDIAQRIEGAGATETMHRADSELTAQNYLTALIYYQQAYENVETKELRDRIREGIQNAVKRWLDQNARKVGSMVKGEEYIQIEDMPILEATEKFLDDAALVERFRTLVRKLNEQAGENLLQRARNAFERKEYSEASEAYREFLKKFGDRVDAKRELGQVETEWAEQKISADPLFAEVHASNAIEINELRDNILARAYLVRGRARLELRKLTEAKADLAVADRMREKFNAAELLILQSAYQKVRTLEGRQIVAEPIPTPVRVERAVVQDKPQLTWKQRFQQWQREITYWVTSGKWKEAFFKYSYEIVLVAGFFLVYWVLPYSYFKKKARRRMVSSVDWSRIVYWTGLLGLIAFGISRLFSADKRIQCPACQGNLNNINLYEDYRYDYCPHCGNKVKPVFTLKDVINNVAKVLAKKRDSTSDSSGWENMLELLTMTFLFAKRSRASDIHFEPEQDRLLARFRIDGILYDSLELPRNLALPVVSAIKGRSNLDISEKRLPQDGHFTARLDEQDINIRVSTLPTRQGEKAVLRLLDRSHIGMPLLEMGFPEDRANHFMDLVFSSNGIILSSGPTGSGKTTLLYSALQQLNDGTRNIVTIEDPIEFEITGINQTQHNAATGLTFATALRSILRQDPDVIMVGEIRDHETASISVNAALTGHMVLSTVHTIDAPSAMARLIDMEVDVKQLAAAMLCIVAQRLVRKLCHECRKVTRLTQRDVERFGNTQILQPEMEVYLAKGCDYCLNTGYRGRTGIFEVMFMTDELRRMVIDNASVIALREVARRNGMSTLREEGLKKVAEGITSIEEVIRVTQDAGSDILETTRA